jgi:transcriptional regulator with XRE-family HTH domain
MSTVNTRTVRLALRRERTSRHLTLDELATLTGLNRATIHSIESVDREPTLKMEFETVARVIDGLGLSLGEFFLKVDGAGGLNISRQTARSGRSEAPEIDAALVAALREFGATFGRSIQTVSAVLRGRTAQAGR